MLIPNFKHSSVSYQGDTCEKEGIEINRSVHLNTSQEAGYGTHPKGKNKAQVLSSALFQSRRWYFHTLQSHQQSFKGREW